MASHLPVVPKFPNLLHACARPRLGGMIAGGENIKKSKQHMQPREHAVVLRGTKLIPGVCHQNMPIPPPSSGTVLQMFDMAHTIRRSRQIRCHVLNLTAHEKGPHSPACCLPPRRDGRGPFFDLDLLFR